MQKCLKKLMILGSTYLLASSCGAPLKFASEVSGLFGSVQTLPDKMTTLCSVMSERSSPPQFKDLSFAVSDCRTAGLGAQNITGAKEIFFAKQTDKKQEAKDGTSTYTAISRLELWLNQPLLGLANGIIPKLKQQDQATPGQAPKFEAKPLGEVKFDQNSFEFAATYEVISTKQQNGVTDIRNVFQINGMLYDKSSFFMTVVTREDADVKESLIKNARIAVFAIPHASDVYIDIMSELTFHSFGVDPVVKAEINKTVKETILKIPELISSGGR
jgi:hypothetical protein